MEALFALFEGMPQQGPGDDATTLAVLRQLALPAHPRVVDLGCGSGRQTLALARALGTRVIAVDIHRPFLDALAHEAAEQDLGRLVVVRQADMANPGEPPGSLDLIWSEGAAYVLGWRQALEAWAPLLRPGGYLVASECSWLIRQASPELLDFWQSCYPAMGTVPENVATAEAAGFSVVGTHLVPEAAWWRNFYDVLEPRARIFAADRDPERRAMGKETLREIEIFRRYSRAFGYVFYLLKRV